MLIEITYIDDSGKLLINTNDIFKIVKNSKEIYEDKEVTKSYWFKADEKVMKKKYTGREDIPGSKIHTNTFRTRMVRGGMNGYISCKERVVYTVKESFEDILKLTKG